MLASQDVNPESAKTSAREILLSEEDDHHTAD
jgi:hypothetical protein